MSNYYWSLPIIQNTLYPISPLFCITPTPLFHVSYTSTVCANIKINYVKILSDNLEY